MTESLPADTTASRPSTGPLPPEWVKLLYEITRQLSSSLELGDVLAKVLSLTSHTLGASAASIFLLDPHGIVTRSILARGDLPPEIKQPFVDVVMHKGFAGWMYRNRRPDLIVDTKTDGRWHFFPDEKVVTRSAIGAPLMRQDEVIGILTLMCPTPNAFTKRQVELIEAIAAQAAAAIEQAALYSRVNTERSMLRAIIAGVQDVILVANLEGQLILANPAAERNLALPEDYHGRMISEILREPALIDFYESTDDDHAHRDIVLEDGRVFNCALVQIPNVGKMLGMHDVTTFKRLDALKNEFVAHVSHDLKAPLAAIQGFSWMLSDSPALAEEARVQVQQIVNAADRMRTLIDSILDIGRIEMGLESEFRPVNLHSVVSESIISLQVLARDRGVSLTADISDSLPPVRGAPIRLGQAITNLIQNGLKFTPPGGSVKVSVESRDRQVLVLVSDTGPGIPPALQARLFQRFARLGQKSTRDHEGHGMGLAIVKSVVEAHGGRVWLESRTGEGSTFGFSLPIQDSSA